MDEEVRGLLDQVEDHRLEFKSADLLDDNESIAKQLVAFANRRGGKLVFGVTDNRELEGVEILGDIEAGKISRIARSSCSPPVDIDHKFCPDQRANGVEGDVLIIKVNPAPTPTAIVDGPSRTYYLRTTNESRPIQDPNELNRLYTRNRLSSIEEVAQVWITFDGWLNQKKIQPTPEAYEQFQPFISVLSTEDRRFLLAHPHRVERYISEIIPFAFLSSINNVVPPTFWITYAEENNRLGTRVSELVEDCDEIPLETISYNTSPKFDDAEPPIHKTLSIDLPNVYREAQEVRPSIVVPEDTTLSISYVNEARSRITVAKDGAFEIVIESLRNIDGAVINLPPEHPTSGFEIEWGNIFSLPAGLSIECNFQYPDRPDPNISQHYSFGNGLAKLLVRELDISRRFDENAVDLYRIEEKIDRLDNKLNSLIHQDDERIL
jgi:hypothetical protein